MTPLELGSAETTAQRIRELTTKECPAPDCDGKVEHVSTSEPSYQCQRCNTDWLTSSVEAHNTD